MLTIALAEVRERFRDPSFLLTICMVAAATTLLAPGPHDAYATLAVEIGARTMLFVSNPGFDGTAAGVAFAAFAPLVGLFGLGGGFARDERTRFAENLRAVPIGNVPLVLGRVLAAWVLAAAFVLAACTLLGVTLAFRYHGAYDVARYAENFLLLALPSMLFTASIACVLDLALGRSRGWYVAAAIFIWFAVVTASAGHVIDPTGIAAVENEARVGIGIARAGIDVGVTSADAHGAVLHWNGLVPLHSTIVQRAITALAAFAFAFASITAYRRRPNRTIEQRRFPERSVVRGGSAVFAAQPRGAASLARRILTELRLRLGTNRALALLSATLTLLALVLPATLQRAEIAAIMLLPALWARTFDDASRSGALDGLLASLPGGTARDTRAKAAAVILLSCAPALAFALHQFGTPASAVVLSAVLLETAWLNLTLTTLRAELLGLGVLGIAWYIVGFNAVPAPVDYMGATQPLPATALANIALAAAILTASVLGTRLRARTA